MKTEVLVILGSPNSPSGKLSNISLSRLDYCVINYQPENLLLCTGGWGAHFNTSEHAHAALAQQYLIENGIPEAAFLDFALSGNTVEDAVKAKEILSKLENVNLTIITSDYHVNRVKLIFKEILKNYSMEVIGVESTMDKDVYDALELHETKAINAIIENGLYY